MLARSTGLLGRRLEPRRRSGNVRRVQVSPGKGRDTPRLHDLALRQKFGQDDERTGDTRSCTASRSTHGIAIASFVAGLVFVVRVLKLVATWDTRRRTRK